MKFLLIILAIRGMFYLLDWTRKRKQVNINEPEEDWSNPSELNVWW